MLTLNAVEVDFQECVLKLHKELTEGNSILRRSTHDSQFIAQSIKRHSADLRFFLFGKLARLMNIRN